MKESYGQQVRASILQQLQEQLQFKGINAILQKKLGQLTKQLEHLNEQNKKLQKNIQLSRRVTFVKMNKYCQVKNKLNKKIELIIDSHKNNHIKHQIHLDQLRNQLAATLTHIANTADQTTHKHSMTAIMKTQNSKLQQQLRSTKSQLKQLKIPTNNFQSLSDVQQYKSIIQIQLAKQNQINSNFSEQIHKLKKNKTEQYQIVKKKVQSQLSNLKSKIQDFSKEIHHLEPKQALKIFKKKFGVTSIKQLFYPQSLEQIHRKYMNSIGSTFYPEAIPYLGMQQIKQLQLKQNESIDYSKQFLARNSQLKQLQQIVWVQQQQITKYTKLVQQKAK